MRLICRGRGTWVCLLVFASPCEIVLLLRCVIFLFMITFCIPPRYCNCSCPGFVLLLNYFILRNAIVFLCTEVYAYCVGGFCHMQYSIYMCIAIARSPALPLVMYGTELVRVQEACSVNAWVCPVNHGLWKRPLYRLICPGQLKCLVAQ